MENRGWIKLYRRLLSWEWYDNPNTTKIFVHLLLTANHCEGKWQGQTIERGACITSLDELARANGLSIQQVRTALKNLEKTGEIDKHSTSKYTKIILLNYGRYQELIGETENEINNQTTKLQQSLNKQTTTNKNNKNKRIKECKESNVKSEWQSKAFQL